MTSGLSRRALLKVGISAAATTSLPVALSACGGEPTAPTNNPAAKQAALPTYQAFPNAATPDFPGTPDGAMNGFLHYPANPKPAYAGSVPGDGKPIKAFAQLNAALPLPLDRNPYWQDLNKRVGSPIEMQLVPSGNDFNAKLATMSAGDDFPDMMQINNSIPALAQFLAAKMADLTPYLSGDNAKKYPALANIPAKFWEPCIFGGKLLALPNPRGMFSSLVMYYRSNVLADAGVDADISNFSDFFDRAKAVTNPTAHRWALASNPLRYIRQMLSIPSGWHKSGDKLMFTIEDERQSQALEATRKLQEAGVINPDMAGAASSLQQRWFGSGQAAFVYGTYSAWPPLALDFGAPADVLGALPMVGYDGGQGAGWIGGLNNNMSVIPKSAGDRVETLLKVADYLASPFGSAEYLFLRSGIEGRHYRLDGTDPARIADHPNEVGIGTTYLTAPPPVLYNPNVPGYSENAHKSQVEFAKNATSDLSEKYYSETASRNGSRLDRALTNLELDIILGRQPVSAWSAGVDKWRADGGDKIRAELQEAIEAAD